MRGEFKIEVNDGCDSTDCIVREDARKRRCKWMKVGEKERSKRERERENSTPTFLYN
jgi:hypothetical protein